MRLKIYYSILMGVGSIILKASCKNPMAEVKDNTLFTLHNFSSIFTLGVELE
jgi:hypothetical protein